MKRLLCPNFISIFFRPYPVLIVCSWIFSEVFSLFTLKQYSSTPTSKYVCFVYWKPSTSMIWVVKRVWRRRKGKWCLRIKVKHEKMSIKECFLLIIQEFKIYFWTFSTQKLILSKELVSKLVDHLFLAHFPSEVKRY